MKETLIDIFLVEILSQNNVYLVFLAACSLGMRVNQYYLLNINEKSKSGSRTYPEVDKFPQHAL